MPEITSHGWLSILPPVLAITLAIVTRQVVLSLFAGVLSGWIILTGSFFGGIEATLNCLVGVFAEGWQTKVILFTLLMGSLLILMQRSGGVEGFVQWVSRWKWAHTRRGAQLLAFIVGLGVFIESTITCLVVGAVARPLFDRLKISREKLAYLCDSTSAPVCMLIPINGWGALVIGLLTAQAAAGNLGNTGPMIVFVAAIPLNFYAMITVLFAFLVAAFDWNIGPMKKAEKRARDEGKLFRDGAQLVVDESVITQPVKEGAPVRLRNLMLPLAIMLLMVPIGIAITGSRGVTAAKIVEPRLMDYLKEASGSTAVLWAVLAALLVAAVSTWVQKIFKIPEIVDLSFKGAGGLVSLAALMMFAFAIGTTCNQLGTGLWVAGAIQPYINPKLIAALVFLASSAIAFATGTSWGTFSIMMPLAVPLAAAFQTQGFDVSMPLVVSAVLGGGVFGDHCSPISDTTIVSSMAACSDHIDHVRTQLPYALLAAGLAFVLYLAIGFFG